MRGRSRRTIRGPGPGGAGFAVIAVLGAWVLLAACDGSGPRRTGDPSLHIRVGFSPTPPMVGEAGIRVEASSDGAALGPGSVVRARVDSEASPPQWDTLAFSGGGSWTGTIRFPAPGTRRLEVEVRTPDERRALFSRPVTVSAAPAAQGPVT